MPAAKRSSSDISDSDADVKQSSYSTPTDDEYTARNTKKAKKGRAGDKGKMVMRKWTAEEEVIFKEVVEDLLKTGIWQAIKPDGRLDHRGQPGIIAHVKAMIRND